MLPRSALTRFAATAPLVLALALGGCMATGSRPRPKPVAEAPPPAEAPPLAEAPAPASPATGSVIGNGSVKVALILPLTGAGQGAVAATSLRNAAELAIAEFQNPDLTIVVKDDHGTADGARDAASAAAAENAELIIGPLFAPAVQAAGTVARNAGKPIIAFSTDTSVASRGIYLLSFMAQSEVDRVVDYAADQGRRSMAALIPETTYGSVVEAQFREAAARRGIRVTGMERYAPGQAQAAVSRLAPMFAGNAAQIDALLIPEGGDGLPAITAALTSAGFNPARVKPLGTGVWNDPRAFGLPALQGGWFAAPDAAGYAAFAGRYRAKFGQDPTRIATLSYDAVSLAAALARQPAPQRFSDTALTNPSGFAGADGVFRFRTDGSNERALGLLEIRGGAANVVSPAPKALGG